MCIKESPSHVLQDRVSDCTVTRCKDPGCFPILNVRKIYISRFISGVFWCPCYTLVVMSNRWNQYKFSTLCRLCISLHRWILVLLLIFVDWYKHSNTNVGGSKCILNRYWCIIWSPNAIVIKMSSLDNGLHNKFGLYVFPIFIGFEFGIYISIIHCAKFEVYTCSICDVVTIRITACSSSFNTLKCC